VEIPIEKTLLPTTVNEVLLLNRISELHRDRLLNRNSFDFSIPNKDEYTVDINQHTLYLACDVSAAEDWRGIEITARGSGFKDDKANLFHRTYVDKEVFATGTPQYVANWLGKLHEHLIHTLAKHLSK
jgi:hypothetical protein